MLELLCVSGQACAARQQRWMCSKEGWIWTMAERWMCSKEEGWMRIEVGASI